MARLDRQARRDKYEKPDRMEPALAAEPTESTEATEPAEPIDRIDPAEPMERIEPVEPIDRIDPLDPILSSDPADPADDESRLVCMIAFSQHRPISDRTRRAWSRGRRYRAPVRPRALLLAAPGPARRGRPLAGPARRLLGDGFNGVAGHIAQNVNFAVAAAADPGTLRAPARDRGWARLRLLSCADNTFKYALGSEDAEGGQESTISVFTLGPDGSPRHSYTAHPSMSDDINQRGIDLLAPVWQILDLTPGGRGDWYPGLGYAP